MKKITGEELKEVIKLDPSWCLSIKEPIEVTTYADMRKSKIITLSRFLHFTGLNSEGCSASFEKCRRLKNACGVFSGFVNFSESGVERTKGMKVLGVNDKCVSADFSSTLFLNCLDGVYEGAVDLRKSNVEEINATVKTFRPTFRLSWSSPKIKSHKFLLLKCFNVKADEKYLSEDYLIEDSLKKDIYLLQMKKEFSMLPLM